MIVSSAGETTTPLGAPPSRLSDLVLKCIPSCCSTTREPPRLALSFETIRFFLQKYSFYWRCTYWYWGVTFRLSEATSHLWDLAFGRRFYDKSYHKRPISTDLATMRFVASHTKFPFLASLLLFTGCPIAISSWIAFLA